MSRHVPGAATVVSIAVAVALVLAAVGPAAGVAPLVASGPAAGVAGSVAVDPATGAVADHAPVPDPSVRAAPNNSTVPHHRNPATVDRAGDLAATSEWLAGRLADRLGEGAVLVERGQYDAARRVVDDRFDDRLARLVDVAGATEGNRDDRLAVRLSRTRQHQRRFVDAVADYRETRRAYLAARRAGNETRARTLARELERAAGTVNETGRGLVADYGALANATDADLARAAADVRATRENVTGRQTTVRAETFVATRLVVGASRRPVSPVDPLALRGRLLAANGSALSDRSVRLRVGERTLTTRTNATGGFAVRYRPVRLAADATAVRVAYRPRNRSPYLGSATSVRVSVRPVTPSVAVAARPSPARFGDRVSVAGSVTAGGAGLAGVPVVVRVGGTRLGRVETAANGSFALSAPLPAGVAAGDRRVAARVALAGRAVAATTGETTLSVAQTPANLSQSARRADGREGRVRVTGRLTAGGQPVAGRPVALRLNGSHVRSVTTGPDGRYAATLGVEGSGPGAPPVSVAAVHDGSGSNLGDAAARATLPGVEPAGRLGPDGRHPPAGWSGPALAAAVLAGALLVAVLVTGGAVARSRWGGGEALPPVPGGDAGADGTSGDGPSLSPARSHLAAGEAERAVVAAYAAVREGLGGLGRDGVGSRDRSDRPREGAGSHDPTAPPRGVAGRRDADRALTHWEFYRTCEAALDEERAGDLLALTEAYERAAFAPDAPTRGEAAAAVEAATALLSG